MLWSLPKLRWRLILISLAGTIFNSCLQGQEPSPSLQQADADYRAGVAALNRNDLKTAQSEFQEVTRIAPTAELGYTALGTVLVREGQFKPGERALQKALAMNPDDASAQTNLALAYEQSGDPGLALPLFAKMAEEARSQGRTLSANLGAAYARALAQVGQSAAAIAQMKEDVALDARNAELRDELGSLEAQQGQWNSAEREFSEAIRLRPDFAVAHLHLGSVFQAEHKGGAAAEWMKASELSPASPQIALAAGKALADAGHDEQAVVVLERARRLAPGSATTIYQLALVLQRVNRVQNAIQLLKEVVQTEPRNADALINLGLALSQAHQATDAIPYLQRAIAERPKNATAYQDLAAAYLQVNRVKDAQVALREGLKLAPDSPQMHYDLGVAYKLQDDALDAIPELEAAENLNPSGYEPEYVLGMLYLQVGRYKDAATQLEASLKLHPQNSDAWATLGSIYDKLNRLPEAANALRESIRQLPDQADAHLMLANVLVKEKQIGEAAAERKIGADLMRAHMNLQRAEVATNTGKSLMADGKTDEAIVNFRNALAFDPGYAEAHLELSKALEREGKMADAAVERAQARSLARTEH